MVVNFPIRRIEWGVWSSAFKAFIHCHPPHRDTFLTWSACDSYIKDNYSDRTITKDNMYPKPKAKYLYNELSVEEV